MHPVARPGDNRAVSTGRLAGAALRRDMDLNEFGLQSASHLLPLGKERFVAE